MCFMWYLNDVFSLLIGVCKEALGLAHRAQQKHRSLSTSRTIQQQLQRSLILAGELRGETKKSRELFANQWSTSWALITLRRLRIDVPGYRPHKNAYVSFWEWSSKPFGRGTLFEAQVFWCCVELEVPSTAFWLMHVGAMTGLKQNTSHWEEDKHGDMTLPL